MSNFETVGDVWLGLRKQEVMLNGPLVCELRLNGKTGALLATGVVMSASINGVALGPLPGEAHAQVRWLRGRGHHGQIVIRKVSPAAL